jgi:peptide/nickel transport system substrate-binding protein
MQALFGISRHLNKVLCAAAMAQIAAFGVVAEGHAQNAPLGTVTIATHLDLDTLDPTQNINTHQRWVYRHIFDPLLTHDTDGNVQPALAERWERVDDRRWRFFLRDDVTFTNGEPFTAESVKFTVELMQRSTSQAASYYNEFEAVEIVDDHTVDLVTKGPYAATLTLITDYLNPVPPKYYAEVGEQGFAAQPVGTGAYMLDTWNRGDRIILKPNTDWALGTPKADQVVFWVVPEPSTRIAALVNGEADIISTLPPLQSAQVEEADGVRVEASAVSVQPIWGGFVVDRPELQDVRVRKAINHAVNKQAIVDRLLRGYGRVMGQPCPSDTSCWNSEVQPYEYDPEKAKTLLAEAGVSNMDLVINFPTGVVPQGDILSQAIAADLQRVGITATIQQDEWSVFAGKLFDFTNKQANLGSQFLMYYKAGPTLERVIATILVSDRNWNWMHYNNPKVDELIRSAETAPDDETRAAAMEEMAAIVHDEAPWLFLYEPFSLWGVSDRIAWTARGDDFLFVEDMEPAAN